MRAPYCCRAEGITLLQGQERHTVAGVRASHCFRGHSVTLLQQSPLNLPVWPESPPAWTAVHQLVSVPSEKGTRSVLLLPCACLLLTWCRSCGQLFPPMFLFRPRSRLLVTSHTSTCSTRTNPIGTSLLRYAALCEHACPSTHSCTAFGTSARSSRSQPSSPIPTS